MVASIIIEISFAIAHHILYWFMFIGCHLPPSHTHFMSSTIYIVVVTCTNWEGKRIQEIRRWIQNTQDTRHTAHCQTIVYAGKWFIRKPYYFCHFNFSVWSSCECNSIGSTYERKRHTYTPIAYTSNDNNNKNIGTFHIRSVDSSIALWEAIASLRLQYVRTVFRWCGRKITQKK